LRRGKDKAVLVRRGGAGWVTAGCGTSRRVAARHGESVGLRFVMLSSGKAVGLRSVMLSSGKAVVVSRCKLCSGMAVRVS